MEDKSYVGGIVDGLKSLGTGLKTTMREFFTPKITEQYPENRDTMACPNGTINVTSEFYETPDGKKKKRLVKYEYNLGSCMFCQLCTRACPHGAITFDQSYENAVFDRAKLILTLNHEGSKVQE